MSYTEKLASMGYIIKPSDGFNGKFVAAVRTGNLVYTAGQISRWGDHEIKGKIGGDLTLEQGYQGARYAALNCLRAVAFAAGGVDSIKRIVKVLGMVNCAPGFNDTPGVIHGCSDLLNEVFGEAGMHARSAVGITIPFDYAVEIEMVVEVA